MRVCVVNFPLSKIGSKAGAIPTIQLLKILSSLSLDIYIVTGNFTVNPLSKYVDAPIFGITHKTGSNVFTRFVNYILTQLEISIKLMKLAGDTDLYIFFIMGQNLLLPMLTAKLLRKKVLLALAASSVKSAEAQNDSFSKLLNFLSEINYTLSNKIILHSPNLIKEWNLEKYKNKICIAHEYFLDFDKFKIKKKFDERDNLVGYVGRLSEEKGILNFVKAIPKIIKKRDGIKFIVGGDGRLRDEIEKYLDENDLNKKVKLTGWVPHDELPDYLNELKLLIIPSYTESGPIIALEAMAYGTPILATRVGHILNMIEDEATGFIMENNTPECIAENVERALNYPDLERIVENARALVEREFTYEVAVEKYRTILENLGVENHE